MSDPGSPAEHADDGAPTAARGGGDGLRDIVEPRSALLVVGAALLCLAFVLSYMGAFHAPHPRQVPIEVVAPEPLADRLVGALNDLDGRPLDASTASDEPTAVEHLRDAETSAVLVVRPDEPRDRLLVASATGTSLASAVEQLITAVEGRQQRAVEVTDVVPHQPGDAQTISGFYLAIGCVLAGYLLAAAIGMAKGNRPPSFRRTLWRLAITVPYAVVVGLGGAIIADPVLGALTGSFSRLWLIGALLVLATATVTMAFQVAFGIVGIGVTILLFVILGNPSAGGAYPNSLLPPFWAAIGPWLPNGAGVEALRRAVYFDDAGLATPLWLLAGWTVGGALLAVLASWWATSRRARRSGRNGTRLLAERPRPAATET